jgi:hypothetical protein
MLIAHKGEELTLDHVEQPEMVYELLQAGRIEIIDTSFIPTRAKYKVLYGISYETKEGFSRAGMAGDEIELDQSMACKYLALGHIKPVSETQWRPTWLLGDTVEQTDTPKKMYDEPLPVGESWTRKWGVRGGTK